MDPLAYARAGVADMVTYTPAVMRAIASDVAKYPGYRVEITPSRALRMWFGERRVVPEGKGDDVLRKIYEDPSTGLFGRDRLFDRVKRTYVGISKRDVEAFVKARKEAQIHAPVRRQKIRTPILARAPFRRWQIDLVDVSAYRASNDGVLYLLTVIDCFSKYAWAVPLKRKTAEAVGAAMRTVLADAEAKWGKAPHTVQSDNGTEFRGEFRAALREAGVARHVTSLPYHPQSQGQIERFNGTLKRLLRKAATSVGNASFLPLLDDLLANYNGSVHGTTRCRPAELMSGECDPETALAAMVKRTRTDMKRSVVELAPLAVGNRVRVLNDVLPKTAARRYAQAQKRNPAAKHVPNWSAEIFVVASVRQPDAPAEYGDLGQPLVVLETADGERLDRVFRRDELLLLPDRPVQERKDTRPTPGARAVTRAPEEWAESDERMGRGLAVPRNVRAERARTRAVSAAEAAASRPRTRARARGDDDEPESSSRPRRRQRADDRYEVEAVVGHRGPADKREYLVKWAGYPDSDNSWVADADFDSRVPVERYWAERRPAVRVGRRG